MNKSQRKIENQRRRDLSLIKKEKKSLHHLVDLKDIKILLLSIQDIARSTNDPDIIFYITKMRADFLASKYV